MNPSNQPEGEPLGGAWGLLRRLVSDAAILVIGAIAVNLTTGRESASRVRSQLLLAAIALLFDLTIFPSLLGEVVLGLGWETPEQSWARLREVYGRRYQTLEPIVYRELVRIDPFRRVYSHRGAKKDYQRMYRHDVAEILQTLELSQPTSSTDVRRVVHQLLSSDPYGNVHGDVGPEERYTELAERIWQEWPS